MKKICLYCGNEFSKPHVISPNRWKKRRYCSKPCAGKKFSKHEYERIEKLYLEGNSCKDIAKTIELSKEQIARIVKKLGILRPHGERVSMGLSKPEVRAKMSLANKGRPCKEHVKESLRLRVGNKNHNWKGGITNTSGGYLAFSNSKVNGENAGRMVHQLVAEEKIGRKLKKGEHVHHVDRNKLNNDPENLVVMSATDHAKLHSEDRTRGLREWLNL